MCIVALQMGLPEGGRVAGIHGVAIPHALNAAPSPTGEPPTWAASFFPFGYVAAEGQGPIRLLYDTARQAGIDAPPVPCQRRKIPAAMYYILSYRILSQAAIAYCLVQRSCSIGNFFCR